MCGADRGAHKVIHSHVFIGEDLEPPGSASSSPDEQCGHIREGGCCSGPGYCAHACAPAKPEPPSAFVSWEETKATAAQQAAMQEPEAPECAHESWEVTGERRTPEGWLKWRKCADCREPVPDIIEAEPHWPRCRNCDEVIPEGCTWCQGCVPEPEAPPRRPPYAVAYTLADGEQYEVALPGDATVRAHEGALIITHVSAVQALIQTRPMETP